jgi:putative spermidine/putrescine transport system substrate-binding protein
MEITRRHFIGSMAALGVGAASLPFAAYAKDSLTVVEWGPPHIDASKKVAAKWDKADITWELQGGGAQSLAKIKATWPNTPYDLVDNWSAVYYTLIKEGWAETVTLADVPNLADVPERFLSKDDKGNIKCIPRSVAASFFMVRTDRCPIEIKTIDDLLNPRLKGLIVWPSPTLNTNIQTVVLALARGGNEFNMEPGWKFLEELARSGNIGRTSQSSSDTINSITTGENCIAFSAQGMLKSIASRVPMKPLIKVDPSLKAAHYVEGWVVMSNSKKKQAAMEFANFTVSKENSELFNQDVGNVPASSKAKAAPSVADLQFTPQELEKFAYVPDWGYMSTQADGWLKRFERDIAPKI